jgi:serine/threonine protein kinase
MFQPGSTIGRYRIVSLIDAGGMADVYRVRDPEGGPDLALKVLPPELARDQTRARRFYQEIRAAGTLRHPNIVALRDVAEADGSYFYTMDLLPGGSLKSRINEGMRPDEALQVMIDISSALIHAHEKGFIHRDIKPGNILFRQDGTALLSDFGIVKVVGRRTVDTRTGMSVGSPHYMSPEQASGKKISPASDLYSLGIVFYEMLTGQVPFDAEESIAVALKHLKEQPRPLPSGLRRFQPVMNKLLAKNEKKRFADAAALQRALVQLQIRTPKPLPATQIFEHVQRPGCKRTMWAAGGGLLAILVMITLFAVVREQTPRLPAVPDNGGGAGPAQGPRQERASVLQAEEPASLPDDPDLAASAATKAVTAGPPQQLQEPSGIAKITPSPQSPATAPSPPAEPHPTHHESQTAHLEPRTPYSEPRTSPAASPPSQPRGAVQVVTTPAAATVWLDGVRQPGRTPLTLSGITAGKHRLRVHKDQYHDIEDTVEIKQDMKLLDEIVLQGQEFIQLADAPVPPEKKTGIAQEDQKTASGEPLTGADRKAEAAPPQLRDGPTGKANASGGEQKPPHQQKIPIVW